MNRLILASTSPRRKEFLEQLGAPFESISPSDEERPGPGEAPADYVLRAARDKAAGVAAEHPQAYVIGADTIVTIDQRIMGKPESAADAAGMLKSLSGKTHEVMTAVVLARDTGILAEETVTTRVTFREISDREIALYVETGEPMDKAGSYAIQGGGGALVRNIEGSYSNVVGFPLAVVGDMLQTAGLL